MRGRSSMFWQSGYSIFVSFSTAILAVSEVSACEDILSSLVGIEIRSNAMGCMQERFTGAYV